MNSHKLPDQTGIPLTSRREFLRNSSKAVAGAALAGAVARAGYAAESNTLKIALVGCGGRGTGAASQALSTKGPTMLWAVADVFEHRLKGSLDQLKSRYGDQVDAPADRRFIGFDAFKKAIDSLEPGSVVLLATPPAFRSIHLEYAVQKGMHVFMEKSFAVDAPGVRRVLRAAELARQKNLKIATGLMWRHDKAREEVIQRIHDGVIGEVHTLRTYRMHGPVGYSPKQPGQNEIAHQISNYNSFTWLNGSFLLDWLIHNIDVCCWAKNALPASAQGMGGRIARTEPDQLYDHYMVEYFFADGAHLYAQGRHINKCWDIFSDFAHGSKGSAVIMENLARANSRLYKNQDMKRENETWRYTGPVPDPYQVEHDLLFDAIRNDKPYNEAERGAKACLVAIMGRMACESGQMVTWDDAFNSNLELAPGLDRMTWDSEPPVKAGPDGRYPLAIPGLTKVM